MLCSEFAKNICIIIILNNYYLFQTYKVHYSLPYQASCSVLMDPSPPHDSSGFNMKKYLLDNAYLDNSSVSFPILLNSDF